MVFTAGCGHDCGPLPSRLEFETGYDEKATRVAESYCQVRRVPTFPSFRQAQRRANATNRHSAEPMGDEAITLRRRGPLTKLAQEEDDFVFLEIFAMSAYEVTETRITLCSS